MKKKKIVGSTVYIAPPDYHLMIEPDHTFSLSVDASVKYSRPSIDVLFETASQAYNDRLIGIILTGANDDGANGIISIDQRNGLTIAQDPKEALNASMPLASIRTGAVKKILSLREIQVFLNKIGTVR